MIETLLVIKNWKLPEKKYQSHALRWFLRSERNPSNAFLRGEKLVLRNDTQSLVDASNLLVPIIYYRWKKVDLISINGRSDVFRMTFPDLSKGKKKIRSLLSSEFFNDLCSER